MTATPVFRPTARIIVLDPDDRVLLFSFDDPRGPRGWFTPGGGLRKGETPQAGAVRELAEETGLTISEADLGQVVATWGGVWRSEEGTTFFGADWFFLVRVADPGVDTSGQEDFERSVITGYRWWTAQELLEAADQDRIMPEGLPGLVCQILESGMPDIPLQLPWRTPA